MELAGTFIQYVQSDRKLCCRQLGLIMLFSYKITLGQSDLNSHCFTPTQLPHLVTLLKEVKPKMGLSTRPNKRVIS